MTKHFTGCLLLAAAALWRPAAASPPDPAHSHVDATLLTCPAGDSVFTVITRNIIGGPLPWTQVTIDLCACPDVVLVPPPEGSGYQVDGCHARGFADAQGVMNFTLQAGGVCSGGIQVYGDGVQLHAPPAVASFDQDGDLRVSTADLNAIVAKRGSSDLTADFDGDRLVTEHDLDLARGHLGHGSGVLGVDPPSPGPVRIVSRPNPTRRDVEFTIEMAERAAVALTVYDLTGRRLATVLQRTLEAGTERSRWSGCDEAGRPVPAGLYFYRFTVGTRSRSGLIVVAR